VFWQAVLDIDPHAPDQSRLAGAREGHLTGLFAAAGLRDTEWTVLTVQTRFMSFEEWWEPFTLGVGSAGDYVQGLDVRRRAELRERCASLLPRQGPVDVTASAWATIGRTR
jgi:hypothetical protein